MNGTCIITLTGQVDPIQLTEITDERDIIFENSNLWCVDVNCGTYENYNSPDTCCHLYLTSLGGSITLKNSSLKFSHFEIRASTIIEIDPNSMVDGDGTGYWKGPGYSEKGGASFAAQGGNEPLD